MVSLVEIIKKFEFFFYYGFKCFCFIVGIVEIKMMFEDDGYDVVDGCLL